MSSDKLDEEAPDNFVLTSGGERLVGSSSEERNVLNDLYEAHEKLKVDPKGNKALFQKLLDATKQGTKAKILAARWIPMFFKHFPSLGATSIDALLDLVEDDDKQVRMATIQYLPDLCEGNKRYVVEIANVLGQLLLGCESERELSQVETSLQKLLKCDFMGTIGAMLDHVASGFKAPEQEEGTEPDVQAQEMATRLSKKSLSFVMTHIFHRRRRHREFITAEVERGVREKILPLLVECDPKSFEELTRIMKSFKIHDHKDADVYSEFVQTVIQKSNLHTLASKFQPTQKDELRKLLVCMKLSFPLYKLGYSNDKFLRFLIIKVIPQIPAMNDDLLSLEILHTLAEMSVFTGADDARKMIGMIYKGLIEQLPNAPKADEEPPVVNFSYLEAFLTIFHHTAHKVPGMLNKICGISIYTGQPDEVDEEDHSQKKVDLNVKLQYAIDKAKEFRQANLEQLMKVANPNENAVVAQNRRKTTRVIDNVIRLGQNLKSKNPKFDLQIIYSWKVGGRTGGNKRSRRKLKDQKVGQKRKAEKTAQGGPARKRKKLNPPNQRPPQPRRGVPTARRPRGRGQGRPRHQGGPRRGYQGGPPPPPQPRRGGPRRDRGRGGGPRRSVNRTGVGGGGSGVAEMRAGGRGGRRY